MSEAKERLGVADADYNKIYKEFQDETKDAYVKLTQARKEQAGIDKKYKATEGEIAQHKQLEANLKYRDEMETARTVLDIAGIADPSPISDGISAGISIELGDYGEAALSIISCIPYGGDLVGKGGKALKKMIVTSTGEKLAELAGKMAKATDRLNDLKKTAEIASRKVDDALDVWKNSKVASAAAKAKDEAIKAQQKVAELAREIRKQKPRKGANCDYGTQVPAKGRWENPNDKGNGVWSNADKPGDETVKVKFKEGDPDFGSADTKILKEGEWVSPVYKQDGVDAKVDIIQSGKNTTDFPRADEAMAHKLGIEKFERPDGYTWHHEPDGTGMVLVDRAAHDKTIGGATHDGGGSLVRGQNY